MEERNDKGEDDIKYPEEIRMEDIDRKLREFEPIDFPEYMKPILGHFC